MRRLSIPLVMLFFVFTQNIYSNVQELILAAYEGNETEVSNQLVNFSPNDYLTAGEVGIKDINANITVNALMAAAFKGHKNLFDLMFRDKDAFMKETAKIDVQNNRGDTALGAAISRKQYATAQELINTYGADVNIASNYGYTPLIYTANNTGDNYQFVDFLLQGGAQPNALDRNNKNALYYAMKKNNKETVKKLIPVTDNVNIPDVNGNTPLHFAAAAGYDDIVKDLLNKEANFDAKNNDGKTPSEIAQVYNKDSTVEILEDAAKKPAPKEPQPPIAGDEQELTKHLDELANKLNTLAKELPPSEASAEQGEQLSTKPKVASKRKKPTKPEFIPFSNE